MMLLRLFRTDLIKQKRSAVWLMLLVIPLGTTAAMFLDMHLRYADYLYPIAQKRGMTSWHMLLMENHAVLGWGMFLPLFVALIGAVVYQTEFSQNGWKSLLSLPVSKADVYVSKWMVVLLFSGLLIGLNALGLVAVGKASGFPEPFDWSLYGRYVSVQWVGTLGAVSIQCWLSSRFKNLIVPIVAGAAGMLGSAVVLQQFPDLIPWVPYAYPFMAAGLKGFDPNIAVYGGLTAGSLFLLLGLADFRRRDIG